MKALYSFFFMSILTLAIWIYRIDLKTPYIITVDINDIVFKTAQNFAKTDLREDQLQRRMIQFKRGLEDSLKEFAAKQNAIVLPKTAAYGSLKDETKAFIAFHNGE